MHELTITGPEASSPRRLLLTDGVHKLGRMQENEIPLEGEGISREHAIIEVEGPIALLKDLGSRNGTQVGGQSIQEKRLRDGDVITLGRYKLAYRFLGAAASPAKRSPPAEIEAPGVGDKTVVSDLPPDEELDQIVPQKVVRAPTAPEMLQAAQALRKIPVNFRIRIMVALIFLVGLSVMLLGFGLISIGEEKMALEALSRARTLTYLLAEMNVEKLKAGEVRLLTDPIAEEVGVRRVILLDVNGQVIAPEALRGKTDAAWTKAHESQKFLQQLTPDGAFLSVPVTSGGRSYGTAVLEFGIDYLKERKADMFKSVLLIGMFLTFAAVVFALFLERLSHKPFLTFASEVDLVLKQDLAGDVPLTTDRRANHLSDALNRLIRRAREFQQARPGVGPGDTGSGRDSIRKLAEVVGEPALLVNEDGLLEFCNPAAAAELQCKPPRERATHLLDAFGDSPHRTEVLNLIKEARDASGQLLSRSLRTSRGLRARARTIEAGEGLLTLVTFDRSR